MSKHCGPITIYRAIDGALVQVAVIPVNMDRDEARLVADKGEQRERDKLRDARRDAKLGKLRAPAMIYTGAPCSCKPGMERDNCPACEGTGRALDFAAIRAMRSVVQS